MRRFTYACIIISFSWLIAATIISGCSHTEDSRLADIEESISTSDPLVVFDSLITIDKGTLSESDRHYYDFLTVKIADKAYIRHSSDSLILSVIKYENSHKRNGRYPEALYYGGRVYSDLGDYPEALRFFQKALEFVEDNLELKGRILSQTGRILNNLRIYSEALPYLEKSINLDRILNDTVGEVYDLQLLGAMFIRAGEYSRAKSTILKSLEKATTLPSYHKAKSQMYLAAIYNEIGEIDSALLYIRSTPDMVKPNVRNSALAYASEIYLANGICDTAYLYSHELISNNNFLNKKIGYHVLLSPQLRPLLNPDSIDKYYSDYLLSLEDYFNENDNFLAVSQQSAYNYQHHIKEKYKLARKNEILIRWIFVFALLFLVTIIISLYLKNRNNRIIYSLTIANEKINRLNNSLQNRENSEDANRTPRAVYLPNIDQSESILQLRNRLKQNLLSTYYSNKDQITISPELLKTQTYHHLEDMIDRGASFKENDSLWKELEQTILAISPDFKVNLHLLTGKKMTSTDYQTAILIRYGITPSQMALLLNRTKTTIASRRESLCMRIFGENLGTKAIDGIILLI